MINPKTLCSNDLHGNISYMFDYQADPVVHLLHGLPLETHPTSMNAWMQISVMLEDTKVQKEAFSFFISFQLLTFENWKWSKSRKELKRERERERININFANKQNLFLRDNDLFALVETAK